MCIDEAIRAAFDPMAVAVIGASDDPRKFSGAIMQNLLKGGFRGVLYPVNPNRPEVHGLKCYRSIIEVPGFVDLACIVVPPQFVPDVVRECASKQVKAIIIISAGFGEVDTTGKTVQDDLVAVCRKAGVRIVAGPNCEGVISLANNLWVNIFSTPVPAINGEIGIVSQSGGIQEAILDQLWCRGIGISHCISVGNEADMGIQDYIDYLTNEGSCKVIMLFIEGVRKGQQFKDATSLALRAGKPIVAMKVGKSEVGKLAAASHTGALAGADYIYDAIFRKMNIIRARSLIELVEMSMMLAWQPLPKGGKIGVITDSGGISCIVADAVSETRSLALPEFSGQTQEILKRSLPCVATARNPLDVTAAILPEEYPQRLIEYINSIAADPGVDIVLNVVTYWPLPIIDQIVESLVKTGGSLKRFGKPFLTCWPWITVSDFPEIIKRLAKEKIPLFFSPENAVRTLDAIVTYSTFFDKQERNRKLRALTSNSQCTRKTH